MKHPIMVVIGLALVTGCTEPEHARDRDPAQALQADRTGAPFLPDAPSYQVREAIRSAALEVHPDRALYLATDLEEEQAAEEERARHGELVAVHHAFPFNVLLRLTNEDTGAQVEVRVIDSGPFVESRAATLDPDPVIAVSPAAARELGAGPGERVPVWVEVLEW
jgi:hypothetical protein